MEGFIAIGLSVWAVAALLKQDSLKRDSKSQPTRAPEPPTPADVLDRVEEVLARGDLETAAGRLDAARWRAGSDREGRLQALEGRLARFQGDRAAHLVQALSEVPSEQVKPTVQALRRLFHHAHPGFTHHLPEPQAARIQPVRAILLGDPHPPGNS